MTLLEKAERTVELLELSIANTEKTLDLKNEKGYVKFANLIKSWHDYFENHLKNLNTQAQDFKEQYYGNKMAMNFMAERIHAFEDPQKQLTDLQEKYAKAQDYLSNLRQQKEAQKKREL